MKSPSSSLFGQVRPAYCILTFQKREINPGGGGAVLVFSRCSHEIEIFYLLLTRSVTSQKQVKPT
jgi:hypothetical protein